MNEFLAYTHKNMKQNLITFAAGVLFALLGYYMLSKSGMIGVVLLIFGVLAIVSALTQKLRERRSLEKWTASGEMDAIVIDFAGAESIADDEARLGERYVFQRCLCDPIRLTDIIGAEYGEKTGMSNGSISAGIYLRLNSGKETKLCSVYGPDQQKKGAEILSRLQERNPAIKAPFSI